MLYEGPVQEHLEVNPYDGTTLATLTLVKPDDTGTLAAVPTSSDGGHNWYAVVNYTAGEWIRRWQVTGTGAGRRSDSVLVAPDAEDLGAGVLAYATTVDLARYLGAAPPAGSRRMLARASELVDDVLLCARYDTDTDGRPTDPDVAAALAKAVCAQVRWWVETGDESGALAQFQSVSIGGVSLGRGSTSRGNAIPAAELATAARRALAAAGLTGQGPSW